MVLVFRAEAKRGDALRRRPSWIQNDFAVGPTERRRSVLYVDLSMRWNGQSCSRLGRQISSQREEVGKKGGRRREVKGSN